MEYGHAKLTMCETPLVLGALDTCHQGAEGKKGSKDFHGCCSLNRKKVQNKALANLEGSEIVGRKGCSSKNGSWRISGRLLDVRWNASEATGSFLHKVVIASTITENTLPQPQDLETDYYYLRSCGA
jgi:hypothetical protein